MRLWLIYIIVQLEIRSHLIVSGDDGVCEPAWVSFASHCYYKSPIDNLKYEDAKANCISYNASLASVRTQDHATFLAELTAWDFWLGIHRRLDGTWIWIDTNEEVTYSRWVGNKAPNDTDCAIKTVDNMWKGASCSEKVKNRIHICQRKYNAVCPKNGSLHYDNCYYFHKEAVTRDMARVECSNAHSGYLTSILSDDEQQFILNITKNERFWIGLSLVGDSWSWDDGSMFNYANWDPAFLEKRFYSELVAVYADKTWKVVDSGSADIGFVCKAKASPAKSQLKSTTTGGKVSLPAIFLKLQRKHRLAILLSILGVMLLGICVFAICLRRSSEAYRTQPGFVRVVAPRDTQSAAYYSVVEHADNQFYQAGNFSAFRNDNAPGFHSIRSSDYSELIDTAGISTAKMSLPGFKNQSFNDNAGSSVAENVAKTVKMRNQLNQASPYLSSNFMQ